MQFNLKILKLFTKYITKYRTLVFFFVYFFHTIFSLDNIHYYYFCKFFPPLFNSLTVFSFSFSFFHIAHPFHHFTIPAAHTVAPVSRNASLDGYFFDTHQEIYVPLGCILSCDSLPGIPLESRADYPPPTLGSSFLTSPIPSSLYIYLAALVNRASSFTSTYIYIYDTIHARSLRERTFVEFREQNRKIH